MVKLDLLHILNSTFLSEVIVGNQLQGHIVCLPKKAPAKRINYRPLTLMNTDYKILTRIVANRLRTCLPSIIHPSQHCGVRGRFIFDPVATVRDVIAYAEVTKQPICVASLDFSAAFDNISHACMEDVLRAPGFSKWFTHCIMRLYDGASSEVQINGFPSSLIPIRSSIRQGCPLSMLLFAVCLNPLLHALEDGPHRNQDRAE